MRCCWPGYSRHTGSVLVDEMPTSVEDPAVMQGHEGVACGRGIVLPILTVCILQWRKLIFSQHLIHHKPPKTQEGERKEGEKKKKRFKAGRECNTAPALLSSTTKFLFMFIFIKAMKERRDMHVIFSYTISTNSLLFHSDRVQERRGKKKKALTWRTGRCRTQIFPSWFRWVFRVWPARLVRPRRGFSSEPHGAVAEAHGYWKTVSKRQKPKTNMGKVKNGLSIRRSDALQWESRSGKTIKPAWV